MTTTPAVAWIGLGAIGAPMARALAGADLPVTAYDLFPAAREAIADQVATAATAHEAVSGADVVAVMVATPEQLDSVLFGAEDGIAGELAAGTVLLIMSTVGPAALDAAAERLDGSGVRIVDAPVSGGVARAADGDLLVMVGGAEADVAAVRPVLDALASNAPVVGSRAGDGQRFKIVNQLLCGVHIAAAGEALALADAMGLDLLQVHEVLGTGAAASFMFADRGRRMVDGAFDDVRSALTIFVKDMGLVAEAADEVGQQVPLAASAQQLYRRGSELGWDRRDDSIVYRVLRDGDATT
ncbi:NAD(P)-dependent oxidoreductase [Brachybacterium paraconglomeratum]|uniref:NAD(P)-dependent oxidoreductase n=1 Tax=Brachybacterium paraconglomeratum TaxID=173362 RepID=UPI0021A3A984|nr:NAD(P)-dependent oxidoreductase [Brachybacterium paraconglomeratum]MCT1910596.1 NAD(P)-dependent oxidoreductase [Brachybacterium paraconglomeratum]